MIYPNQVKSLQAEKLHINAKCGSKEHVCSRAADDGTCHVYAFPGSKWRAGDCPLADTAIRTDVPTKSAPRARVGQQKQKKNK